MWAAAMESLEELRGDMGLIMGEIRRDGGGRATTQAHHGGSMNQINEKEREGDREREREREIERITKIMIYISI